MRPSASILFVAALLTFGSSLAKADDPADMPDIIFLLSSALGGFGHLAYDAVRNQYALQGDVHTYTVDDGVVRLMRANEETGIMADPHVIAVTAQGIYGGTAYGILRYNSTGSILNSSNQSSLHFSSSPINNIFATDKGLFQMGYSDKGHPALLAYNSELQKIGELSLEQDDIGYHVNFLQVSDKLYSLDFDSPNTHTSCADGPCHIHDNVRQIVIDLADPAQLRIVDQKYLDVEPQAARVYSVSTQAVSPELQGWLLVVTGRNGLRQLEWRTMAQPDKVAGQLTLPQGMEVVSLAEANPFALIEKTEDHYFLHNVSILQDNTPALGNGIAIPLPDHRFSSVRVKQENDKLFIASDNQLLIFNYSGQLMLQQTFTIQPYRNAHFSFGQIAFAHGLER